ncbi:enamidase [Humitalea rosea]|uniref:Enamidase n=1 Tax=Humitalea rosea TaxID=990373 RepID=A0A2W7I4Q7_9PROT|nr:amidohydrolase family protein [Humitalea rosea]PZW40432.1 enamidase [Humitalea rosea]
MARILVRNIGLLLSGDIAEPVLAADALLIEKGVILSIGRLSDLNQQDLTQVIDAGGCAVGPGLIDNHVHPVFGDWTPRQNQTGWIEAFVQGGCTTMFSAGEVHLPGRPKDPVGVKALAITAQRCFDAFRPLGARVFAGAPVAERSMVEADYAEMAACGVGLLGEIGLGTVRELEEARTHAAWARKYGLNSMIHCGGPSIAGSNLVGADVVIAADCDTVAHINGGPTSLGTRELTRVIEGTTRAIEIVHNGNPRTALHALNVLTEMGRLDRLVIGTDSPAGSGVQPLGVMRTISFLVSVGGLEPSIAIACASGNTARFRAFSGGRIAAGLPADLLFMDQPQGSEATDVLEALSLGDLPGIGMVMIDGVARTGRSRNTPPAARVPVAA